MELHAVKRAYRNWARVYDWTFGLVTRPGRSRAVEHINVRPGRVLEIGVGTGLALGYYRPNIEVTGVDVSSEMLAKARRKVAERGLGHVRELREMDARHLDFPDNHFDTVVAMYLVSVVPEPEKVVAEMARVCRPGGEVVIVNHFASEGGALGLLERALAPAANLLGWHPDFPLERVMGDVRLQQVESRTVPPFGMFTFLRFLKNADASSAPASSARSGTATSPARVPAEA